MGKSNNCALEHVKRTTPRSMPVFKRDVEMIRDRMPDLLRLAREDPKTYHEPEHHHEVPMPYELEQVLLRVEKILKFLNQMKAMIKDLKLLHQGVFTSASIINANQLRNKITVVSNRFSALARKTENILRRIELNDQDKLRYGNYGRRHAFTERRADITVKWEQTTSSVQVTWPPPQSTPTYIPAESRMQITMHDVLAYSLTELVQQFYTEQKNYNLLSEQKIKRQLSILGREMDKEELGRAVDENIPLLHREIKDDQQVSKRMRQKLKEVAHFENEILQLESNISQLHKAFLMVATLVQEQGVVIDRIEHHVTLASDYVESSNQHLKKAGKLQRKYRKKKCIFALLVVFLLLLIIAIVCAAIIPKIHGNGNNASAHQTRTPRTVNNNPSGGLKISRNF